MHAILSTVMQRDVVILVLGLLLVSGRWTRLGWCSRADIAGRAKSYLVEPSHTRLAQPWPWGQADARVLLSTCHGGFDEALGLLLVGSVRSFEGQVGFLLREL